MKIVSRKLSLISIMLFSITLLQFSENKKDLPLIAPKELREDKDKEIVNLATKRLQARWERRGVENIIIPRELK